MQVKRLCASIDEAQLQACPSVLPPFAQNTHLGTEQSCCKHTCVFITTATTGEFSICTVENLFRRFTAVNESLLLLRRKRTLDLCMPIVETPPNDPFVQKCHLKVQKVVLKFANMCVNKPVKRYLVDATLHSAL